MIYKENILNNPIRKEIFNLILNYPGLYLREISRRKNISLGTLRYHINKLKKHNLIISILSDGYSRYYVSKEVGNKEKELFHIIRQDMPQRIIQLLHILGPGDIYKDTETMKKAFKKPNTYLRTYSIKELIDLTKYWMDEEASFLRLNKHETTIRFHINKLLKADIIEKVRVEKEIKYRIKDYELIDSFIEKNKSKFDNKINKKLQEGINYLIKENIDYFVDNLIKTMYEIFPNPYYV